MSKEKEDIKKNISDDDSIISELENNKSDENEINEIEEISAEENHEIEETNENTEEKSNFFYKRKRNNKSKEVEELESKLQETNDKYLRLSAEFDNFRKRTLKERMELTKTANESMLLSLLPVVDDFDRALQSITNATDIDAVKEGFDLIYLKFQSFLDQKGVKEIDAKGKDFDTDLHEAITKIPVPQKNLKGKVIDEVQKGYMLFDKVIRYSKVVIGE